MININTNPFSYSTVLGNFLTVDTINDKNVITPNNVDQILQDNVLSSGKFFNLFVNKLNVSTSGYIMSGKTSFTDSTHSGWFMDANGVYIGKLNDDNYLKFKISDGTLNFKGTVSGLSTDTIASSINSSGNFINQLINSNLNTSSKQILGGFTFGSSGSIKMAADDNNGLWLSPNGILAKNGGATTFTITSSGNAIFSGSITSASMNASNITGGSIIGSTIKTNDSPTPYAKMDGSGISVYGKKIICHDLSGNSCGTIGGYYDGTYYSIYLDGSQEILLSSGDMISLSSRYGINFNVVSSSGGVSFTGGGQIALANDDGVYIPQSGTSTPLRVGSYYFRPVSFTYTLNGVNHTITVLATGDPS